MSIKEFVEKAEWQSKESINRAYSSINMVYYEINFLNDLLMRYLNKKSGRSFTVKERQGEMNSIRERISSAYQDINYYKECINTEKREMKRIYDTYGYWAKYQSSYEEPRIRYECQDEEYDDFIPLFEYLEDLEEIKDYKYNPITDTWE
jgi:hypothetical protein